MDASGTRIAHISDVHMLDARPGRARSGWGMRHHFLSFGRRLDVEGRRDKLASAMSVAQLAGADRVVISGDLTEIGAAEEYESLAEVLAQSVFAPERVTLVPGNHDLYTSPEGWRRALQGPLRPYAASSASRPGVLIEHDDVTLMPLDVTIHQPVTRSAGMIADDALEMVERRASDPTLSRRPLVVVQHHPPFVRKTSALHWLDGLVGAANLMALLEKFRHLFVLHGHLHAAVNRVLECGVARVLGATATVEDRTTARVRLYDVREGRLVAGAIAS